MQSYNHHIEVAKNSRNTDCQGGVKWRTTIIQNCEPLIPAFLDLAGWWFTYVILTQLDRHKWSVITSNWLPKTNQSYEIDADQSCVFDHIFTRPMCHLLERLSWSRISMEITSSNVMNFMPWPQPWPWAAWMRCLGFSDCKVDSCEGQGLKVQLPETGRSEEESMTFEPLSVFLFNFV